MYPFEYFRASGVEEASKLLLQSDGARLLAGGMSLLPAMKHRLSGPPRLVDLGALEALRFVKAEGKRITIGALTAHATVAASPEVAGAIPALARLAGGIGDVQVRHRGTIGGSIANNDP